MLVYFVDVTKLHTCAVRPCPWSGACQHVTPQQAAGRSPEAVPQTHLTSTLTFPPWPRALFDVAGVYFRDIARVVHMDRSCAWKYLVYIEAYGYSSSLKLRLACGSVLFQGDTSVLPLTSLCISSDGPQWVVVSNSTNAVLV